MLPLSRLFALAPPLSEVEIGLLYVSLAVFLGASVAAARVVGGQRRGRALRTMFAVGTIATSLLIVVSILEKGRLPIRQPASVVLLLTVCTAWGVLLLDQRLRSALLLAVVSPVLLLLLLCTLILVPGRESLAAEVKTVTVYGHVVLGILGCVAFTLAGGTGMLYLWQIRTLKRDPTAALGRRLPPLETLDRWNFLSAAVGVPLLFLSLVVGWAFVFGGEAGNANWILDPTVLAVTVGLLVYLLLFVTRAWFGWRGRRTALLSVIGFVLVVIVGTVVATFCPDAAHYS